MDKRPDQDRWDLILFYGKPSTNVLVKISELYDYRFDDNEKEKKNALWKILPSSFFQKYIPYEACVLDVGAGFCKFINNKTYRKKYAIELNEDISSRTNTDVHVTCGSFEDLSAIHRSVFDIVFMSNFLEHLKSKENVLQVLACSYRLLTYDGRIMVLQPNIRYLSGEYWDFFDHHIPISDKSLVEALRLAGFEIELVVPRFLPYTTKSKLPQHPALIKNLTENPLPLENSRGTDFSHR